MTDSLEIDETISMITQEKLDVRTITMGISLLDCVSDNLGTLRDKILRKITTKAKDLVAVGRQLEVEFGIPIVNKRISVTPISLVAAGAAKSIDDYAAICRTLDQAAEETEVNFLGGYSALVSKSMTPADELLIRSLPQALSSTERVCASVNVGSTKTGIDMDAVELLGHVIKRFQWPRPIMTVSATPSWSSSATPRTTIPSWPGLVSHALDQAQGKDFEFLCESIKKTAFKVTRVGQLVAQEASARLGAPFGIIDLSLAPTPAPGDSVGEILEKIGLAQMGGPGTTAALALLNDQVKKGGIMASSYVGGLSGAFIPVSEDKNMIEAAEKGNLTIEKLEAMTCVCSVGLDMIAIPGDTADSTISGIIADEAAIGMVNQKTTAVRIIPVIGKEVGEQAEFGGLLGRAPIMPVNQTDCSAFVSRGGRIPALIHSFKN